MIQTFIKRRSVSCLRTTSLNSQLLYKKYLIPGFIALVTVILFVTGFLYSAEKGNPAENEHFKSHYIVLSDSGFEPGKLTIRKGDEVVFLSKRSFPFWPASDIHPTHDIYPEFDSKRPLAVHERFTLRFNRIGKWRFHDHVSPHFMGEISVEDNDKKTIARCVVSSDSVACWQEKLLSVLETEGVDAVFDALSDLYVKRKGFPVACHSLAHDIGLAAYNLYLKDPELVFSSKAVYCASGFYHGFMEALLKDANGQEARNFCDEVGQRLAKSTPDAELQCHHGIGHGALELVASKKAAITNEHELIKPALRICEGISSTKEERYRCASGVFNGIANLYISRKYGFSLDADDPLRVCHQQPEVYQEPCYGNMNSALLWFADNNFARAVTFIKKIKDNHHGISSVRYLAVLASLYSVKDFNYREVVSACYSLSEDLRTACIQGIAHGQLEHGIPGSEYIQTFDFCSDPSLAPQEQDDCFYYIITQLSGWYSVEKKKKICSILEERYKRNCDF